MRARVVGLQRLITALAASFGIWISPPPLPSLPSPQVAAASGLTNTHGVTRAYDLILNAEFNKAAAALRDACGPAPATACRVIGLSARWWRMQLDAADRSEDEAFLVEAAAAIADAERWTSRERDKAEAWFYLGAAYGARAQLRALRGQTLGAARDGKRIKTAFERALALDPDLADALLGIGLYHYYAGAAPTLARVVGWLLLLPGGDREEGLAQMLAARARNLLLGGEAEYQLHRVYLWFEQDPRRALESLDALRRRYPRNPLFVWEAAAIHDVYLHDLPASLDVYRDLLTAAEKGAVSSASIAEVQARLGAARMLDALGETDRAIDVLSEVVADAPADPYGAHAQAHLQTGLALDRLGRRAEAESSYRAAIAAAPPDDPAQVRRRARQAQDGRPDSRTTEAYRRSLEGLRAFERRELTAAAAALDRALALAPHDPATRYRLGLVHAAVGDDAAATAAFERAASSAPPHVLAAALYEAARLRERAGRRADAIDFYRRAAGVSGASSQTRAAAARALTRLQPRDTMSADDARRASL